MTTPTGTIRLSDVNAELGRPRNQRISLNDAAVRALAQRPSGWVNMGSLRGKSSYTAMTVTPQDDYQSYMSTSSGTAIARPAVSVSGGSGGYSYTWSFTNNPQGAALANANFSQCSVSKNFNRYSYGSFSATLQCVVQDNTGHTVTVGNINCGADWESGM
ncbi:hypothetical protein [Duganella sp. Root336D2]|uniref:hypothetical protein n=1 Tax=Duganella sp. Root336D2 TaxID=1736518 RepID=UPI000ABB67B8|nr:hypothetical protein [Duganella sp. Root336D2]